MSLGNMLSNSWFRKCIPEFFSSPPPYQWWEKYLSAYRLNKEDKVFLSYYTEEEYLALFPEHWYVGVHSWCGSGVMRENHYEIASYLYEAYGK